VDSSANPSYVPEWTFINSNPPSGAGSFTNMYFKYPTFLGCAPVATAPIYTTFAQKKFTLDSYRHTDAELFDFTCTNEGDRAFILLSPFDGVITSINDANGFNIFSDWTVSFLNITCDDGEVIQYRKYIYNNPLPVGTVSFTIKS
jgi:hypothetical protein